MEIYLQDQKGRALFGYKSDVVPRAGERIQLPKPRFSDTVWKTYVVVMVSHRVTSEIGGDAYRLLDVTVQLVKS